MSLTVNCPNCGAEVVFRSAALPARVCDHCQTMLVRSDAGVAVAGKSSPLPFDVSPLRIGMRGRDGEAPFEVIGRVRWGWTDGSWNEWLLLFGDGSSGWLGDAMGQFMLLREAPVPDSLRQRVLSGKLMPGTLFDVIGARMMVGDSREVVCLAAEGELPFTPTPGSKIYSIDLRGEDGESATLQRDGDEVELYTGRYLTLDELKPVGMRTFEGWALPSYG